MCKTLPRSTDNPCDIQATDSGFVPYFTASPYSQVRKKHHPRPKPVIVFPLYYTLAWPALRFFQPHITRAKWAWECRQWRRIWHVELIHFFQFAYLDGYPYTSSAPMSFKQHLPRYNTLFGGTNVFIRQMWRFHQSVSRSELFFSCVLGNPNLQLYADLFNEFCWALLSVEISSPVIMIRYVHNMFCFDQSHSIYEMIVVECGGSH